MHLVAALEKGYHRNRISGNLTSKSGVDGIVLKHIREAVVASNVIDNGDGNGIVLGPFHGVRKVVSNNAIRRCLGYGIMVNANSTSIADNKVISTRKKTSIEASGGDSTTKTKSLETEIAQSSGNSTALANTQKMVMARNVIVDGAVDGIVLLIERY